MPSRAVSRNESSKSSDGRQHERSRFTTEKPLSLQDSFKDKVVKPENSIRPPHSDIPFEFVKNADGLFVIQMKSCESKEEEIVKYMSKVPSYLQRGEKLQDNVLNFGVLDWGRLEQWTHKREKVVVSEKITETTSGSSSSSAGCSSDTENTEALAHSREQPSSPVIKPLGEKLLDSAKTYKNNDTSPVKIKSSKSEEKYLGTDSSNYDHEGLEKVSRKLSKSNDGLLKRAEIAAGLKFDTSDQYCSGKQEGIVLLFPKDFSSSVRSKVHRRASLDGKSAAYNWGSFSDLFSIDEIQPEESFSEIPRAFPLNSALEIEKELDLKLDTLIKSQGVEIPVNPSDMPLNSIESKVEVATSNRNVERFSDEVHRDSSIHRRFSSGLARMTRSLSFRESSRQPPLSSSLVKAKSGPAKPEHCSINSESNSRAKVSPLRRSLDPIFKPKVADQLGERSDDLIVKPAPISVAEEHKPPTSKALLHLTVKSGLPLFKFVVGRNNEIFASTVKSLSTIGKDDMSWLYTFYSVQKITKRSNSWKIHQKVKPCSLGYTVVGQMKVSESEQKSEERHRVKESVLYNVELSKADEATSEFKTSKELAAIIVNVPDAARKSSSFYTEGNLNDCFADSKHKKLSQIVVILPDGDHSLPHDGAPSSLITRWRNGGSCDCGGWDIGCKLRILTEKWQQHKYIQVQCDLYDQGEAKKCTPFFSLIPLRDGLFSVEYDQQIPSLQAFSISVALISSHNPAHSADATDQIQWKQESGSTKAFMAKNEGPGKHAPHPPLSPVGRV